MCFDLLWGIVFVQKGFGIPHGRKSSQNFLVEGSGNFRVGDSHLLFLMKISHTFQIFN